MDTVISEMILSGVMYTKHQFISHICIKCFKHLCPYICIFEVLKRKKNNLKINFNIKDNSFVEDEDGINWSDLLIDIDSIKKYIREGCLKQNKHYNIFSNDNCDLIYSFNSKSLEFILNTDSFNYINCIKYISQEYKYYLDNMMDININIRQLEE